MVKKGEKEVVQGLRRALRIVLDVATSLRMSAGAKLLRTGSQSVLVHRTAPVMEKMLTILRCSGSESVH